MGVTHTQQQTGSLDGGEIGGGLEGEGGKKGRREGREGDRGLKVEGKNKKTAKGRERKSKTER